MDTKETTMDLIQLAQQTGLKPKWAAGTQGGEYHSSCPACGGKDRFYIQPKRQMKNCLGFYCCRRCEGSGDTIQFACDFLEYSFKEAVELVGAVIPESTSIFKPQTILNPTALKLPPKEWLIGARELVDDCHKTLLRKKLLHQELAQRGITHNVIVNHKIGWLERDRFIARDFWGLPEELNEDGVQRQIYIPRGIVIPIIESNGNVIRLKIRRSQWNEGDKKSKYATVSGNMKGLSIIGSQSKNVVVIVESEFDAFAIDEVAGDAVCAIAAGSNITTPDIVTDRTVRNAKQLIICHDNDKGGKTMLAKWKKLYRHAIAYPTPIGKDIGEAIQQGLDVREWLLEMIHKPQD